MPMMMDLPDAISMTQRRLCSDCYGHLLVKIIKDSQEVQVTCANPDCENRGTVSKKTVEIRKSNNIGEFWNMRDALGQDGPAFNKNTTEDAILKELFT